MTSKVTTKKTTPAKRKKSAVGELRAGRGASFEVRLEGIIQAHFGKFELDEGRKDGEYRVQCSPNKEGIVISNLTRDQAISIKQAYERFKDVVFSIMSDSQIPLGVCRVEDRYRETGSGGSRYHDSIQYGPEAMRDRMLTLKNAIMQKTVEDDEGTPTKAQVRNRQTQASELTALTLYMQYVQATSSE